MDFIVEKDDGPIPFVLAQILDASITGITLSDPDLPDNPIIYANEALEKLTGYPREQIIGLNCRFLHGQDRDQPGLTEIRQALKEHRSTTVMLRNYRKDGTLFHNRFTLKPILDKQGNIVYFLGIQHDMSEQLLIAKQIISAEKD